MLAACTLVLSGALSVHGQGGGTTTQDRAHSSTTEPAEEPAAATTTQVVVAESVVEQQPAATSTEQDAPVATTTAEVATSTTDTAENTDETTMTTETAVEETAPVSEERIESTTQSEDEPAQDEPDTNTPDETQAPEPAAAEPVEFVPTPTFPPTVVAFGDSLTAGVGASSNATNYPSLLSNWLDLPVINEGVSGDTTADALARIDDIVAYNPDIVIVFLGGNDILQFIDLEVTITNLTEIIMVLRNEGAHIVLVGTHNTTFQSAREAAFRALASEMDVLYVPEALRGILGVPDLLDDPVHPNDEGYRILAERIFEETAEALDDRYPDSDLSVVCEVWPENAFIGEDVNWSAYQWGAPDKLYSYAWDGTDNLMGFGTNVTRSYSSVGTKSGEVTATYQDETIATQCRNTTEIDAVPIVGHCEVALRSLTSTTTPGTYTISAEWKAAAGGGTGEYEFTWTGSDGLTGDEASVSRQYTTAGTKNGTVTITSGNDTLTQSCNISITNAMLDVTDVAPLTGGCTVNPGDYSEDVSVSWGARYSGGTSTTTSYLWSGNGDLDGATTQNVRVTYDSIGNKTGEVVITRGTEQVVAQCAMTLSTLGSSGVSSKEGCFIATAAYGSYLEPHVATLRAFRDEQLLTNTAGQLFVKLYYATSPPIADYIAERDWLRSIVRGALYPLVQLVELMF